ncbi:MAG: prepilin-type N-terminal cleavage/methylation domain-containing protein [Polyangiaceae bacterium]
MVYPKTRISRFEPRKGQRGFTLLELIVVVIIIAVLSVLAIPAVLNQLRDRRVENGALEIGALYRNARMRAMARGGAVLVRFDGTVSPQGRVEVREALRGNVGGDPNCQQLPVSSCSLSTWVNGNPDNKLLSQFDPANRAEWNTLFLTMNGPPPANAGVQPNMDICFTPMGRAFVRFAQVGPFVPLTGVSKVTVARKAGGNQVGLARSVLVLPNGHARGGPASAPP